MKERCEHIDIAKGISICLVAMFHSHIGDYYPSVVEPMGLFRMPLFFLLSGVFFSWKLQPYDFFTKKFDYLLKPYFVVLFTLLFIDFVIYDEDIGLRWVQILYGNGPLIEWAPLWFLTHLFLLYCFTYILFKYGKFYQWPKSIKYGYLLTSITIGTAFIDTFWVEEVNTPEQYLYLTGLPFSLDIILVTSFFFISGIMLKSQLIEFKPSLLLISLSVIIFYIIQLTPAHIGLNRRTFDYPFLSILGSISGIYLILFISYFIKNLKKIRSLISLCGKSSLFILIFHVVIEKETYKLMIKHFNSEDNVLVFAITSLILSIVIPIFFKIMVEKVNVLSFILLPVESKNK